MKCLDNTREPWREINVLTELQAMRGSICTYSSTGKELLWVPAQGHVPFFSAKRDRC